METTPDDAKDVMRRHRLRPYLSAALLLLLHLPLDAAAGSCKPTEPDALGPFYKPGAPVRASVGKGYVLEGTVRSARDCAPIEGAAVELWLAGPDGGYGDAYRATVIADGKGVYRFESHVPPPYYGRPPHIHLRVSARGFDTLVTQQYPEAGRRNGTFDVVLVPVR
ncbi:MAG: intradiol ring-cleavage dioxygenase [Nitrospirae bacterium]|nr:intradiol ring-cleavage dioxygenase [Nitrospirota bacterium]